MFVHLGKHQGDREGRPYNTRMTGRTGKVVL